MRSGVAATTVAALKRELAELRKLATAAVCTCGDSSVGHMVVDIAVFGSCAEVRKRNETQERKRAGFKRCPVHPDREPVEVSIRFDLTGVCEDAACECHTLPGHRAPGCATPGLGCPTCRPDFWERPSPPPPPERSVVKAADGFYSPIASPAPRASAPAPDHLPGYYLGPLAGPRELALAAAGFARATSALEPVLFSGFCSRRGCFHTHQEHGRGGCTAQVIGSASLCPCKSFLTKEMT